MESILNYVKMAFEFCISTSEFETFLKLVLVSILAGIVGFERENWSKPAGFRTHVFSRNKCNNGYDMWRIST